MAASVRCQCAATRHELLTGRALRRPSRQSGSSLCRVGDKTAFQQKSCNSPQLPRGRPPGEAEHPVTLYPTGELPRAKDSPKDSAPPRDLSNLQPGDKLDSENAPRIANTSFTLSCELSTTQRDAILVAHGGASAGYALHLSGGNLIWGVRQGNILASTQTEYPADQQPHRISASLGKRGLLTLKIDENPPVTADGPGLIRSQPKEDFCVAHDSQVPVAPYTAKGKFEGKISKLKVATK